MRHHPLAHLPHPPHAQAKAQGGAKGGSRGSSGSSGGKRSPTATSITAAAVDVGCQYLVKWRGLGYADATWEDGAALTEHGADAVRGRAAVL